MGLVESRDYERVCLGEAGFSYMIEALAGDNTTFGACDVGVSSITASTERENRGIRFSRATHRSALAVLVHAPLKKRGMWAFFEPLHLYVWMALIGTVVVTPFFVFFFEAVFSKWCALPRSCACIAATCVAPRHVYSTVSCFLLDCARCVVRCPNLCKISSRSRSCSDVDHPHGAPWGSMNLCTLCSAPTRGHRCTRTRTSKDANCVDVAMKLEELCRMS